MVGAITNRDFLRAIFAGEWPRAHVAAFDGDPGTMAGDEQRRAWAGGAARDRLAGCSPERNTYYCVGTFSPGADGRQRRRKGNFDALHVLVFDDVGHGPSAKVDPAKITARGILPSYRLETSPENEQWGFILAQPETNRARAEGLIKGLIASGLVQDNKDPGQSGVTRYVRLPVGTNRKAKYGPGGFPHRLVDYHPERRVSVEDMARAWSIDLSSVQDSAGQGARVLGHGEAHARNRRAYVFRLLDLLGLVRDEVSEPGKFDIRCPFCDLHGGGDETGTAWLPREGVIYCHHGHGSGGDNEAQHRYVRRLEDMMLEDGRGAELRDLRHEIAALEWEDANRDLRARVIEALRTGGVPGTHEIDLAAATLRPADTRALMQDADMLAAPGADAAGAVQAFRDALAQARRERRGPKRARAAAQPERPTPPRLATREELDAEADRMFADALAGVTASVAQARGGAA